MSRRAAVGGAAGALAAVAAGLSVGLAGGEAWAQAAKSGEAAPPLDKWAADLKERAGGVFPFSVAFVTDLPQKGPPKFLMMDAKAFTAATYMRLVDPTNVDWELKLNRALYEKADSAVVATQLARADTLILAPPKGQWQFLQVSKSGKREVLKKLKGPASTKVEDIIAWLPGALNWDGVVLDQRGDYILVGSTARILSTPQVQALAIDKSSDKFTISTTDRKGAGLLSLGEFKGGVGIFDIVFLGQGITKLPVGTKLIIEKKK